MIMENMPPGFRFYPTEQELVTFYLREKLEGNRDDDLSRLMDRVIPVVNIYNYNPDQLPKFSEILCHKDTEQWFFFVPRQESEARGGRPNRLTATGFWKATGSPGYVYAWNRPVGEKKTMVFYVGKAPNGTKTEWKMNEYKAIDGEASSSNGANSNPVLRQELSLCRIYKKSKCLRAFDRRPLPDEEVFTMLRPPIPLAHQPPYYHHDHQATASRDDHMIIMRPPAGSDDDHQMAPSRIQRITSSPESSASEDHHHHHHHGPRGSSDQNMGIMNPSDSDFWDQLDCFCGMP